MTRTIQHGTVTGIAADLDNALYQASVLCAASEDGKAVIYGTTARDTADAETGEKYLILRGDESWMADHLRPEQGWTKCYTLSRD